MNQGVGFSWLHALLISMTNVTSAGQLAGVPIIAAGGTFLELAASQLVINLRYALMSVSLSQKMGTSVRLIDRFLIAFINTDEVFAIALEVDGNDEMIVKYDQVKTVLNIIAASFESSETGKTIEF